MTRPSVATREEWLQLVADEVRPLFRQLANVDVPPFAVSIGWPHGKRTIGECWPRQSSADKLNHVFIAPTSDANQAVVTLIHEMCHVVDDAQNGHGAPFIKIAKAVGLVPHGGTSWLTAEAGLELITTTIAPMVGPKADFPKYPHGILLPREKAEKKQGTRMIKIMCEDTGCGYTLRTTQKWIDLGLPSCYCGSDMEVPES